MKDLISKFLLLFLFFWIILKLFDVCIFNWGWFWMYILKGYNVVVFIIWNWYEYECFILNVFKGVLLWVFMLFVLIVFEWKCFFLLINVEWIWNLLKLVLLIDCVGWISVFLLRLYMLFIMCRYKVFGLLLWF